ncbi:hypothetical protein C0J52_07884 [Blattella germanica]|nr:hypothetical protein C0J52_07884 [Blattella germanica]
MFKSIIRNLVIRKTFDAFNLLLRRRSYETFQFQVSNIRSCCKPKPVTWLSFLALTQAFTIFRSAESSKPDTTPIAPKAFENILSEADELYDENKYSELLDLLYPYKDTENVEILWRLSRVMYNMSKQESSKEEKKHLVFEAYELIERALQLSETHFAVHKCFNISAMPWYQRKIASTIFASPPSSSFEEALFYFNKAEEVDPNFYSQNLLMLGKTYLQLKKEEKARYYLKLALNYPARTDDDLQARKEAAELLKNLEK